MKITYVLVMVTAIWGISVSSSLAITIEPLKEPVRKVDSLLRIGNVYFEEQEFDKALVCYKKIVDENKISQNIILGEICTKIGDIYSKKSLYPNAIPYYLKAQEYFDKGGEAKDGLQSTVNIGTAYAASQQNAEAIKYLEKALDSYKENGETESVATILTKIAAIYKEWMDFDQAIDLLYQSLELYEKLGDETALRAPLMQIASCYSGKGDEEVAKGNEQKSSEYYRKALDINLRVLEIFKKYDITEHRFGILNNIGHNYAKLKDYKATFRYYEKSKKLAESSGDDNSIAVAYLNIGHAQNNLGQFQESIINFKKSLYLSEKYGFKPLARYNSMLMSFSYESLRDYKNSLKYLRNYNKWKDSLFTEASSEKIAQFKVKYNTEQKEQRILLLNKENELKASLLKQKKLENQRSQIIIGAIFLSIMMVLLVRQHEKRKSLITEQENLRFQAVMEVEQKERRRIARDLHDSLGQMVCLVKMNATDVVPQEKSNGAYDRLIQNINRTYEELRTISHNFMPHILLNGGLIGAVEELVENYRSEKLSVQLNTDEPLLDVDKSRNVAIYRIIQECLSNIVKHASASLVKISIIKNENEIVISIKDNGSGIDTSELEHSEGIGWKNIRSRVVMLKGEVEVQSKSNFGTLILIRIKNVS